MTAKGEDISVMDIPDDMKDEATVYHDELVEKICDFDEDLMMQYLDGDEPCDDLKRALRQAVISNNLGVPVLCGSAHQNKGIQKLLDAVVEYMPAPTDVPAVEGTDLDGNEVECHSTDDALRRTCV